MSRILLYLFLGSLCFACTDPDRASTATNDRQFRVADPNELYFRNVRATNYRQIPGETQHQDVYRYSTIAEHRSRPQLFAHLVLNWLEDEAYLLVAPNSVAGSFTPPLTLADEQGERIVLGGESPQKQLEFAEAIADRLNAGLSLSLVDSKGRLVPILKDRREVEGFLITLADFRALVK